MEKVKLSHLKENIQKAKQQVKNPVIKEMIDNIEIAIKLCPPEYLRITKMNHRVTKVLETSK